ncbi:hypothetical protein [Streptomyces griseus]|uniref:hypothetical protein n=1 Tax=Streptomyces griseus TaxID=1911 RepID=UPI00131D3BCF|nr:hypothetical protein [Streptomyces griseus]
MQPLSWGEDAARWPGEVAREDAAARRTYAARCALADAQDAVRGPGRDRGPVPLPTAGQGAAMELVAAGDEVAARWREEPAQGTALGTRTRSGGHGLDEGERRGPGERGD